MIEFRCATCNQIHSGVPSFGWDRPYQYFQLADEERDARCDLGSDDCVIDGKWFFIRGCLEIPIIGHDSVFTWGVWVSLSEERFIEWARLFDVPKRSDRGPYFGWLCSEVLIYPSTLLLKTTVHLRDDGIRPFIELEPNDHPLAIEQRDGITMDRVAEIYSRMIHGSHP